MKVERVRSKSQNKKRKKGKKASTSKVCDDATHLKLTSTMQQENSSEPPSKKPCIDTEENVSDAPATSLQGEVSLCAGKESSPLPLPGTKSSMEPDIVTKVRGGGGGGPEGGGDKTGGENIGVGVGGGDGDSEEGRGGNGGRGGLGGGGGRVGSGGGDGGSGGVGSGERGGGGGGDPEGKGCTGGGREVSFGGEGGGSSGKGPEGRKGKSSEGENPKRGGGGGVSGEGGERSPICKGNGEGGDAAAKEMKEPVADRKSQLVLGVNAVTRSMEQGKLEAGLVCSSSPSLLFHHLLPLAALRSVPFAALPNLSKTISQCLGIKRAMCIGIKV